MNSAAILVLGSPAPAYSFLGSDDKEASGCSEEVAGIPLSCIEILGSTILQRTMQRFADAGVNSFTILADASLLKVIKLANIMPGWMVEINSFQGGADVWPAVRHSLEHSFEGKTQNVFLMKFGAYAEFNADEVHQFAAHHNQATVRVHDRLGSVGTWLVNEYSKLDAVEKEFLGQGQEASIKTYFFDGYVNRLSRMHDLRRFVLDVFHSRCEARPQGTETRPGVWVGDGAQLHKQARIVPPAYIGKNSKVGPASLLTRSSSVERDCNVEYGTVVEDSSILTGTYIGTGLDVTHSVVWGNMLVHLEQNLVVEINDEVLIGNNVSSRLREVFRRQDKNVRMSSPVKKGEHPTHWKGIL